MLEASSNRELLKLWRNGHEQAAQVLVQRYMLRLTALARSRLSRKLARRLDPEDIVLSAWRSFFVAADAGRFSLSTEDDLWPLLVTITLRKLSRQASRHSAVRRDLSRELPIDEQLTWQTLIARDPSPEEAAFIADEIERLMSQLSESDRTVLSLRLQGHDHAEIAKRLQCSDRTVRRAMVRVRELLQQREDQTGVEEGLDAEPEELLPRGRLPESRAKSQSGNRSTSLQPTVEYTELTLQKLIGVGGFGKVYRAIRNRDGSVVAVKFLKKRFWRNRRAVQDMLDETQRVSSLCHPSIIRHHGWGRAPQGATFIVMDWIDGLNVGDWSSSSKPSLADILRCGISIAAALEAAHAEGLVHGDVTPGNVLRSNEGAFILTDFGFAQSLAESSTATLGGTPAFLAPEQVSPLFGQTGPQTDVYGLAGLLYFLITGQPPVTGADVPEILANVLSSRPIPSAETRASEIPAGLDELLGRCLQKEPAPRPGTMREVRESLERISLQ